MIDENQALRLRATRAMVDGSGIARSAGEEWLQTKDGAYLPGVFEKVGGHDDIIYTRDLLSPPLQ